jgi:hypothetical protein
MLVEKKMRWTLGGKFELPTWFITVWRRNDNFIGGRGRKGTRKRVTHQTEEINLNYFIVSLMIMIPLCYTFIDNYEAHNIRITQLP